MTLRRFNKNDGYAFVDATSFRNQSPPWISEFEFSVDLIPSVFIVSSQGIEVCLSNGKSYAVNPTADKGDTLNALTWFSQAEDGRDIAVSKLEELGFVEI